MDKIEEVLKKYKSEGYPIKDCPKCKKKTYVVYSEGITSSDEHYPLGECLNCRPDINKKDTPKIKGTKINKGMDSEEVVSAVCGITKEQVREEMTHNKEFMKKLIELTTTMASTANNDGELIALICTSITALLQPLPPEARASVMKAVAAVALTGKSDEMLDRIRKFKDDDEDGNGL